jgi:hypothetical protein
MSVRSEFQHRATHLGRSMKAGLSPLWAVITGTVALVGGSVAITVAWGVRHLYWGLVIALVLLVVLLLFRRAKSPAPAPTPSVQRAAQPTYGQPEPNGNGQARHRMPDPYR